MKLTDLIMKDLENKKCRSAWSRGVNAYALELCENLQENEEYNGLYYSTVKQIKNDILNGASSWVEYSWGGCSLIYDADICDRLATPSEQKKTHHGRLQPNKNEEWLDTQARALFQACHRLLALAHSHEKDCDK